VLFKALLVVLVIVVAAWMVGGALRLRKRR
jgi:hypothetical protein